MWKCEVCGGVGVGMQSLAFGMIAWLPGAWCSKNVLFTVLHHVKTRA